MKKFTICLAALCAAGLSGYAAESASIVSDPSPALLGEPVTITVTLSSGSFSGDVYVYSWVTINNTKYENATWAGSENNSYKMVTKSNKEFTYTISDMAGFWHIDADDFANLTELELNFIAKTSSNQTEDLSIPAKVPEHTYPGGEGTAANPWQLSTSEDLIYLSTHSDHWAGHFKLTADIDASGLTSPIGNNATPFSGSFDGADHSILNLKITQSEEGAATGLFGVADNCNIHDLGVVGADISGTLYTGAVAGLLKSGDISRCFSTGKVTATSICAGGLVGENISGAITDCYSAADVSNPSDYATGGLVGKNSGTVTNTYATGSVAGHDYVGGLIGANYGTVRNSIAVNSRITSSQSYSARFGGNNNSRNNVETTYAWDDIPSDNSWSDYGDHSGRRLNATEIAWEKNFKTNLPWDFNNVWKWLEEKDKSITNVSPVLRDISYQKAVFPADMINTITAVESATDDINIAVTAIPNPTDGPVTVSAGTDISSVNLYSLNGSALLSLRGKGNSMQIDLSGIPQGVYIMHVAVADHAPAIIKIIKK